MSRKHADELIERELEYPDDDEFYNGSAVEMVTVKAGTTVVAVR